MAKKSIWSKLFDLMKIFTSFFFNTLFAIIRILFDLLKKIIYYAIEFIKFIFEIIFKGGSHIARNVSKGAQEEVKKQSIAAKQPKVEATYSEFESVKVILGTFEAFERKLTESKSTIGIILGSRGSGKSALGMRLLENIHSKSSKTLCAMGFLADSLPSWIKSVDGIEEIPNGSFVLIDEGGILFSSRGSMTNANKLLSDILLVARHKDLSVLFISQNSANLEINAIRQTDYLLLRKSSLLQKDFERKKIKDVYTEAEAGFDQFTMPESRLTYVYSDQFRGYTLNELPSFWSDKTSKSFKDFKKTQHT
ncbi:hypothetical protein HY988_01485 [Candidatus Micrarchaeota archaeon]|nr:hypothetical protein [Candidatus Micrarchaeota archaeon]